MGAEQSSDNEGGNNFMSQFDKNFQFVKETTDKRFGEIIIYKNKKEDSYVAKRSKVCNSSSEFKTAFKQAHKRKGLKHKNLLSLQHFTDSGDDNMCGDFNKLTVYFDYYTLDLEKELTRRREKNEYLNENEMWYLLDSLINVGCYLEKHQLYHGDYKPSSIFLTGEGQVKVGDNGIINSDKSAYFKSLGGEKCLLAPSLIGALKNKEVVPKHDNFKSDIYSLGMTMLEVADLAPSFHCYDWSSKEIKQSKIEDALSRIQIRYGEFFAGILRDMLQADELQRPSFEDVNSVLAPYQETIQNFEEEQQRTNPNVQQTNSRVVQTPVQQPNMGQSQYQQQPPPMQQSQYQQQQYQQPYQQSPQQYQQQPYY